MTVYRQFKQLVFECDTCEETFEGEPGEAFDDVWEKAKGQGWKVRKIGHEWVRGCPRCGV